MNSVRNRFVTLGSRLLIAFSALSVTTITADKANGAVIDGLVNYWSMDDSFSDEAHGLAGSASTVNDELIPSDITAFDDGRLFFSDTALFGQSIEMTGGENDGHLFANPSVDVVGAAGAGGFLDGNMSISTWAQATTFESSWQAILAHGEGGGYRLHRRGSDSIAAFTGNSSGDTDPIGPGTDISPGTGWHHFLARVTDNVAELWVDGRLQGMEAAGTPEDRGNGVHIGQNPDTSGREWRGQIDDVGMWNRGLTDTEITEIYLKGLQGFSLLQEQPPGTLFPTSPALPGPSGGSGFFGIREIRNNGAIVDLSAAVESATNGGGVITDGQHSIFDVTDPDSNPDGGSNLTGPPLPFLTDTVGSVDDNITSVAKGTIRVEEGGLHTIQVDALDGMGIRVVGQQWDSVHGAGVIDPNDLTAIVKFDGSTSTRGVINLNPGDYDIELISWGGENSGHYEVTSAQGVHERANTAQWIAIGDPTVLPEATIQPLVSLPGPVVVANGGASSTIAEARNVALAALGGDQIKQADALVLLDPGAGCPNGPGQLAAAADIGVPFPISDMLGAGQDNFTTGIFGQFEVDNGNEISDEIIELTIGMFSDDRAQFRIAGESFSGTAGDANTELVLVDGDLALTADFDTCNTNAIGHISLEEGLYVFEGLHTEAGGDAGWQIWWAEGTHTTAGDPLVPLTMAPTLPANTGLALVSSGVGDLRCDFNNDNLCDHPDIDALMNEIAANVGGAADDGGPARGPSPFDLNNDGLINDDDRDEWLAIAATENGLSAPYQVGDTNLDLRVDAGDLNNLALSWQSDNNNWSDGNLTGAGVNASDLNLLALSWQQAHPDAPAAGAVPEPSSLVLLLAGLLAACGCRRNRRS